jgi:hypothetical protein
MTINDAIAKIKENRKEKTTSSQVDKIADDAALVVTNDFYQDSSVFNYLSKEFGTQTFKEVTDDFVKKYSKAQTSQILSNQIHENIKAKLIMNFLSCQLLVCRPHDNFSYVTDLMQSIRKLLDLVILY